MEIWKPLRDFPSYNVSSEGRVMNVKTQRILATHVDSKGRLVTSVQKNGKRYVIRLAKLVAQTFLGDHPGMDVRHRDLDTTNVSVRNLYWSTRSETISDAYRRGSKQCPNRISITVVETGKPYDSIRECSRDTGCDPSDICKQLHGLIHHVKGLHFVESLSPR
jgi:hypothetical protein